MDRCLSLLLAWPDRIDPSQEVPRSLEQSAVMIRLNQLRPAEVFLLARIPTLSNNIPEHVNALALLAQIRLLQGSLSLCNQIILNIERCTGSKSWIVRWLRAQLMLQAGELAHLSALPAEFWADEHEYPLLALVHIAERLANQDLSRVEMMLARIEHLDCLEIHRLRAGFLQAQRKPRDAFKKLYPLLTRAPELVALHAQVFDLVLEARQMPFVVPVAREAISMHGEHPALLNNVSAVKLHQRQPGFARRSSLLLGSWASIGCFKAGMPNQICSYEQCGNADWLDHLHPAIWSQPLVNPDLSGNLVLHLASTVSFRYASHVTSFVTALARSPDSMRRAGCASLTIDKRVSKRSLSVGWISGDFTHHPVSRFMNQFLAASHGLRTHRHSLISLVDHGTHSNLDLFRACQDVEVVDVSSLQGDARIAAIRDLSCDIVVDLAGWTGGHFALGFLARLAPVQVNYLGYFASTGLPTMDYWLGDNVLFQKPLEEWCTETRWSLPRPFLAWQPTSDLPEGSVSVTDPPLGPVRFGSFNNNRKLSDQTLRLWGEILAAVPESKLVLKANAGEDLATQELLARRMRRAGLDPMRVEWLELTPDCTDHLLQYRHIDIALDPLPNGGCTTTCEALWMGCPVITLCGQHYVSRMSAAVLSGAGLSAWICDSPNAYVQLAVDQALCLEQLRQRRHFWRIKIATSPLGDAADLMRHLETAFTDMVK